MIDVLALHAHLLHHAKGPELDYVAVAIASFLSWAGLPGPGEPVLIAAGVFSAKHKLDITPVVLVAFGAATAGGIVGWLIGRIGGRSLLTGPGPLRGWRIHTADRGEELFKRVEVLAILLTPSWVAGMNRSGPVVYNLVNLVSAFVWAGAIGWGSYYLGNAIADIAGDAGLAAWVGLGLLIISPLVLDLVQYMRRRRTLKWQR